MQEGVLMSLPDLICCILFILHSVFAVYFMTYCFFFSETLNKGE